MKKIFFPSLAAILFFSFIIGSDVYAKKSRFPQNSRKSSTQVDKNAKSAKEIISADYAVLIDFDTGEVLFSKNADKRFRPASMTKLMTVYIVFCAIRDGKINLEDEFPVSMKAQRMEGSRSFFRAGTFAKVEDLIKSIIIHSGNDACVIISEGLYGDESTFVDEMNQKAEEFGLQNTHFNNAHGLTDDNHFSSAYDLAVVAKHLITDFPQFYEYFSEKSFTVNGITQPNRNVLLGDSLGVDGLKTGHTEASGWGIVVSAKKGGKRLISVVNGCKNESARAQDSRKLLTMGFRQFSNIKIAKMNYPITTAKVWMGVKNEVGLCTHEDIVIHAPDKYKKSVVIEAKILEPVEAPVVPGAVIGKLTYKFGNFVSQGYDLFACESVDRLGMLGRAVFSLNNLVFGSSSTPDFLIEGETKKKVVIETSEKSAKLNGIQKTQAHESENAKGVKKEDPFLWRKNSQDTVQEFSETIESQEPPLHATSTSTETPELSASSKALELSETFPKNNEYQKTQLANQDDDENLEDSFPNQQDANLFRKSLEQGRNNVATQIFDNNKQQLDLAKQSLSRNYGQRRNSSRR